MIEIIMGVAILAASLVPIAWYFVNSSKTQSRLKSEAIAAGYAGKIMSELLTERPFDTIDSSVGGTDLIDGTNIQWSIQVADHAPDTLSFTWTDLSPGGLNPPPLTANILDAKFRTLPAVKDITMTIQWKGPRDADFGGTDRTRVLVTRRARL